MYIRILRPCPFVRSGRSDQSALKRNARVLRTGSGQNDPIHAGSNKLAQFSRSGRPKRGKRDLGSCGGKHVRTRVGPFHLNWLEPVLFHQPERTHGPRSKYKQELVIQRRPFSVEFPFMMTVWWCFALRDNCVFSTNGHISKSRFVMLLRHVCLK